MSFILGFAAGLLVAFSAACFVFHAGYTWTRRNWM
jgi:hypothetical protein